MQSGLLLTKKCRAFSITGFVAKVKASTRKLLRSSHIDNQICQDGDGSNGWSKSEVESYQLKAGISY